MKIIDDGKEIFVKEVEIKGKNMINTCFVLRNENVLLFTFEKYQGDFICQADSKRDYQIISQYYYKKPQSRFNDEIREIIENPYKDNQIFYISLTTLFIYNAETNQLTSILYFTDQIDCYTMSMFIYHKNMYSFGFYDCRDINNHKNIFSLRYTDTHTIIREFTVKREIIT